MASKRSKGDRQHATETNSRASGSGASKASKQPGTSDPQNKRPETDAEGNETPEGGEWTAEQIGSALKELWIEYGPHMTRMRVRRMLLELADDAKHDDRTGTHLPKPYDKSKLILKTLIGDAQDVVQNYTARVAANEPQTSVIPVALSRSRIAKRVEERAAEQERLLMSQWQAVHGRQAQRQSAWSQAWGRVGWYLTLPREASWGLPDRAYFEDLTDDEIEAMRRTGAAVPTDDGRLAESAESWLDRRRNAAEERALSGRSLFTLEEFGPDMVLPRYDRDGTAGRSLKYGFVIEEVPASDFRPGTELARAAARQSGVDEADVERYGLYLGRDGKIAGGVTRGGEPHSQGGRQHWTLARFVTREEIYYFVTETPNAGGGRIIWHDVHGGGQVPLIPVPGMYTDSSAPGAEYASLMESVFALTPIINQIETLLSNVATWNALGRFVIEDPGGQLLWVRWMRMLDEPIYAFAVPGRRQSDQSVRGLIEFDPADLVESIRVEQSSQSAQQRVVLRQAGIELLQAGRIDEHEFYERYDLAEDPEESIVRAWAQRAVDIVMLGNTSGVDSDSVLADIVKAVRGRITMELMDRSPNFALAQAESMAATADQAAQAAGAVGPPLPSTANLAQAGNVAAAMGIREPGLGMPIDLPGNPLQGAGEPPFPGAGLGPVTAGGASGALGLA